MKVKKTWFSYLSIFLFLCGGLYVFICAMNGQGSGREYPYFVKGVALGIIAFAYLVVVVVSIISARLQLMERVQKYQWQLKVAEWAIAIVLLLLSVLLRVLFVQSYPMEPQSDYKTYYEIAVLLNKGTLLEEGIGYCDYVAMFPHVLGYSYVLSLVMKYFGLSIWVGQCFNIILAVLTCFIVWRIAIMLAGRVSGLVGLFLTAFWPSQIIYNNFLASEYLFSFLLYLSIWLFLVLVKKYDVNHARPQQGVFLHVVLGILLALDNAVRPMALLLLISILICLIPSHMPLTIKPRNDLSISERILEKGWLRGWIILCSFMISAAFLSKGVSYTVNRQLPGGSASFGYNLLVGLNQTSYGGWNEEDSQYLYSAIEETGSAVDAQIACRDLAFQRLKVDKVSILNLFLHKFDVLWSNDDYASSFNIIFMQEQGNLTSEREDFFYGIRDLDNVWYLTSVAFSMIAVLFLSKRSGNWSYLLVILFLGTVAMHFLVENQNRYHFHALYLFVILTSVALHYLYFDYKERLVLQDATKEMRKHLKDEEQQAMERILAAQTYAKEQLYANMEGVFDMDQALKTGHIEISVTQSYAGEPIQLAEVAATKEIVAKDKERTDVRVEEKEKMGIEGQVRAEKHIRKMKNGTSEEEVVINKGEIQKDKVYNKRKQMTERGKVQKRKQLTKLEKEQIRKFLIAWEKDEKRKQLEEKGKEQIRKQLTKRENEQIRKQLTEWEKEQKRKLEREKEQIRKQLTKREKEQVRKQLLEWEKEQKKRQLAKKENETIRKELLEWENEQKRKLEMEKELKRKQLRKRENEQSRKQLTEWENEQKR